MNHQGLYRAEPYRATRLWLEAVAIFRKGVPLGKNRKQWKTYEDCFVAQEGVSWFTTQLQDKFDPSITRSQAFQLLQKFYKAGIFTEAANRKSANGKTIASPAKETDFKDNGHLYVLAGFSNCPNDNDTKKSKAIKSPKGNSTSASSLPKSTSKYSVVINPLSVEQIHQVWRDVFLKRFVEIVGCEVIHTFPNQDVVRGQFISHNLTQLGKYGVVLIGDPKDEIPSWLLSAMKCLSSWPNYNTVGQGMLTHVNYPGFENDVFKLIGDYFLTFKGAPLLTYDLYDAFITTFIRAELFDFNSRLYSAKTTTRRLAANTPSNFKNFAIEDNYPFNASDSVGNLLIDILTPAANREARVSARAKNIIPKKILHDINTNPAGEDSIVQASKMLKPMSPKNYGINKYLNPFFYETAFTGEGSPVTRVVSQTELKSALSTIPRKVRLGPVSSPACFAYENPNLELSASDMINHPKYLRVLPLSQNESSYSFFDYSQSTDRSSSSDGTFMRGPPVNRSSSAANLSDGVKDRSPYAYSKEIQQRKGIDYANSPSKSARRTLDFYYGADACVPGLMTSDGKRMAVSSFRLLTLLLPPANRRHLQLLLRCMSKISKNEKLMLDVAMTTRAIVINTFFRSILLSGDLDEFDELLALRIVTFMMDNDTDIFDIGQEEDITHQTKEIISDQQILKIPTENTTPKKKRKSKSEDKENVQYCSRISLDEFDDQRLLAPGGTSQHLRSLLINIVESTDLSEKEKKKRLKDFKSTYPHIYQEKFESLETDPLNMTKISNSKKDRNPFKTLFRL